MRHYPEYKESGVAWIGEIPVHWKIGKIKHIATFVSQKSTPETDAIKISPENVESETGKVLNFYSPYDSVGVKFQDGDVLFNKLRVYLSKVVFAEYSGYSLGEMIVIRSSLPDIGKYLFYLMLSCRFVEYCNSISEWVKMPRTAVDDILNAQIPLPSHQEQTQIANFLDRKTGQIDELIRIKERRIELLQEQRTALINQTVTKGFYPNVEMKPSGVEWIGKIPKDRKVTRLKYICESIVDCEHKTAPTQETGYPLIRTPNIGIGHLILDDVNRVSEKTYQEWSRRVIPQSGDLILAREAPIGNVAIIPTDLKVCLGQRTVLIRPDKDKVYAMFLVYLMLGDEIQVKLLGHSTGAIVHHLNMTDIRNLELPRLPSLSIQRKIANFLDHKIKQIDELISVEQGKIELLKEYRQSLIFEVVTGKIDVRGIV